MQGRKLNVRISDGVDVPAYAHEGDADKQIICHVLPERLPPTKHCIASPLKRYVIVIDRSGLHRLQNGQGYSKAYSSHELFIDDRRTKR